MFHVKHRTLLGVLRALLGVFAVACGSAASPHGWAAPAKSGSVLLVSPSRGKLSAIDPATGTIKWTFPDAWNNEPKFKGLKSGGNKLQGIYAQPVVASDNTVFVGDYNGWVYALSQSNPGSPGSLVWASKTNGPIIGGLYLDSGSNSLFVTSADGYLYGLNAADGSQRLKFKSGDRIWSPPVLANGNILFGSTDRKLYAINPSSGSQAWTPFSAGGALVSEPAVAGTTLYIGSFDDHLYAIDTTTGAEKWQFGAQNWVWSRPLVNGNTVYAADFDGNVYALDTSDGHQLWAHPFSAGSAVRSGPAIANGVLVISTDDGHVYGLDPATGTTKWDHPAELKATVHADLYAQDANVIIVPNGCTDITQSDTTKRQVLFYSIAADSGNVTPMLADKGC